jgi:hypothetical protein
LNAVPEKTTGYREGVQRRSNVAHPVRAAAFTARAAEFSVRDADFT